MLLHNNPVHERVKKEVCINRATQKEMFRCFLVIYTTQTEGIDYIIKIMSKFIFTQVTRA